MIRPELLAPAGSLDGLKAAINAGADAVYLGGNLFGARAYAQNFTEEELLEGLMYAHLRNRKVYLTVNTLVKNEEMKLLRPYLTPYVKAGLDAVIVQDLGVVNEIRKTFPNLKIHASTQMTVTSVHAGLKLKEMGVCRIVPARELSAQEIKEMTDAEIEVEAFIHGSMCYCYSGQCLFSSMLGERSGNRGRCAQPCRLPYSLNDSTEKQYFLSMKDMCTIENLAQIMKLNISSFKIEGRMKNAAYTAGVTFIYRKYIDLLLEQGDNDYRVEPADLEHLKQLYVRTSLQNGYYNKNKGRDMITLNNPAYGSNSKDYSEKMTEQFVKKEFPIAIDAKTVICISKPMEMTLSLSCAGTKVTAKVTGNVVQQARTNALNYDDTKMRLLKTGGTGFVIGHLDLTLQDGAFVSVKQLNELRRDAILQLNQQLKMLFQCQVNEETPEQPDSDNKVLMKEEQNADKHTEMIVFTESFEQFCTVLESNKVDQIAVSYEIVQKPDFISYSKECNSRKVKIYISLPAVMRNIDYSDEFVQRVHLWESNKITGIYCNQIDQVIFLDKIGYKGVICGNYNLYCMNDATKDFYQNKVQAFTVSTELSMHEMKHLSILGKEVVIYGRTPLMQTTNCVCLTGKNCMRNMEQSSVVYLTDRYKTVFPVRLHCQRTYCYNTIYNSVPISLHKQREKLRKIGASKYQIRFTTEDKSDVRKILHLFLEGKESNETTEEFSYTNGHFMKGIL